MLRVKREKYTVVLLISMLSLLFSTVMVIMLAVYNNIIKEGATSALPVLFNYFALSVAILFCVICAFMIVKRKSLKWFDFLAIALVVALWFAATIYYATLCTSMQFPGDTKTLYGFYGIFFKMEIIKTYNLDQPVTFMNVNVNFEFMMSIIFSLVSSVLYFVEKSKANKISAVSV